METRGKSKRMTGDTGEIDLLSEENRALYMLITGKFDLTLRDLEKRLNQRDAKINNLEQQISALKKENADLSERLDEVENYERRDTLILSGEGVPHAETGENAKERVKSIIKEKLKCELGNDDLVAAYRIGKKPLSQQPDKRNLMVKFRQRNVRDDILQAGRTVKPQGLYVNENLTASRSKILFALRRAKRFYPERVAACGSSDGRVFVWLKPQIATERNLRIFVNSITRLDDFLKRNLDTEYDSLLARTSH